MHYLCTLYWHMSSPLLRKPDIISCRSYPIWLGNHKDNELAAFIIISGGYQRYSGMNQKSIVLMVRFPCFSSFRRDRFSYQLHSDPNVQGFGFGFYLTLFRWSVGTSEQPPSIAYLTSPPGIPLRTHRGRRISFHRLQILHI